MLIVRCCISNPVVLLCFLYSQNSEFECDFYTLTVSLAVLAYLDILYGSLLAERGMFGLQYFRCCLFQGWLEDKQ